MDRQYPSDIAFSPTVKAVQARKGSRHVYARMEAERAWSARVTPENPYYKTAEDIARRLSQAGFSVISGGGPGIMEAANKGAYEGASPSVGLNISLPHEQGANAFQDVSHTFQHFFARKVMFVKMSCAFVMMPGGFGTLDELMEVLTLVQTGKIRRVRSGPPVAESSSAASYSAWTTTSTASFCDRSSR